MNANFERHTGDWEGVVMIIRPDPSRQSQGAQLMCKVVSARTVQLNGKRAINCELPYSMFINYFNSTDKDHIFCEAEFKDGHLEIYGQARTNLKDWVVYSMTTEQLKSDACAAYK